MKVVKSIYYCQKEGVMRVIEYGHGNIAPVIEGSVYALGFFDGVHLGHRLLIADTVRVAKERGLCAAVFTFRAEDMRLKSRDARLYSTEEKLRIFEGLGVDTVVIADFGSVAGISDEDFVRSVLWRDLGCRVAVSGRDFRFGRGAKGDSDLLRRVMEEEGGEAIIRDMEKITLEDGTRVEISSTAIRAYLASGKPDLAAKMLGEAYHICSKVERGLGLGRHLGFPTLNTGIPSDAPLKSGVYAASAEIDGKRYTALTNIGTCPTIGERELHAESYLIDYDGDAYGSTVRIYFLEYIREERAFPTREKLIEEVKKNISEVKKKYGRQLD